MTKDILEFQGENRWLSNFWPVKVTLDGVEYPSIEHAYQAAKTFPENRGIFANTTPGEAKRLGRKVPQRPEREEIKLSVMWELIQQKFSNGSSLAEKLLSTGKSNIVEGNAWGDVFWGVCKGRGQNNLGKLIMRQRDLLGKERLDD